MRQRKEYKVIDGSIWCDETPKPLLIAAGLNREAREGWHPLLAYLVGEWPTFVLERDVEEMVKP